MQLLNDVHLDSDHRNFCEKLVIVIIKKHAKFHNERSMGLCVIALQSLWKSSKCLHVQTLCARNAHIMHQIKLIFVGMRVALVCIKKCVKFKNQWI